MTRFKLAGACLLLVGCLLAAGLLADATHPIQAPGTAVSDPTSKRTPAGAPVRISIPAIGVDAKVVGVGLRSDGAMEVPAVDLAGWYEWGPRPGEPGPAVIIGHVDGRNGPAVFYRLRQLHAGQRILVLGASGATSAFTVEAVEQQPKSALPVGRIWNRTTRPVLRLITCGGSFDRISGRYRDNVIVYAKLSKN